MLAEAVYLVGALVTWLCGVLLMRGVRACTPACCFGAHCVLGLSVSNVLVFLDLVIFPQVDLYRWRLITAAIAMGLLSRG